MAYLRHFLMQMTVFLPETGVNVAVCGYIIYPYNMVESGLRQAASLNLAWR